MTNKKINIVGAGLAGVEAAYYLANCGHSINLYEMKPNKKTQAHTLDGFGELVCSNSLRSNDVYSAPGLLKEEMRMLNSLMMKIADKTQVPAGGSFSVDRHLFSNLMTKEIKEHENINVIEREIADIDEVTSDDSYTIFATGPLTTGELQKSYHKLIDEKDLYFFDAASPIIDADSIDFDIAFYADRYDRGTKDYVNCPMNKEEYDAFYEALVDAELAPVHDMDKEIVFEGCMPIESMAKRGYKTPLFGPMKPVGIKRPNDDEKFYAVVQLRKENVEGSMFNMVGFQTRLRFPEQKRVFSMIPGLENATFLRYGVMHRNTFIQSPKVLDSFYRLKSNKNIFFAGQITGVEGYIESAASGLYCAIALKQILCNREPVDFGAQTAIGALSHYISNSVTNDFQPMNINFGIMTELETKVRSKKERKKQKSERAIKRINEVKVLI